MLNYVIKRIAIAVPTMLILIVLSFLLMHAAPGGPFTSERPLPPQVLANIEAKYGLDQPPWRQMFNYVWSVVTQFDFGPSFKYKDRTVNEIIGQGFLSPLSMVSGPSYLPSVSASRWARLLLFARTHGLTTSQLVYP